MRGSGGEPSVLDKFVKVHLLYIVKLPLRDGQRSCSGDGTMIDVRDEMSSARTALCLLELAPIASFRRSGG
jgi:hypothetical protein